MISIESIVDRNQGKLLIADGVSDSLGDDSTARAGRKGIAYEVMTVEALAGQGEIPVTLLNAPAIGANGTIFVGHHTGSQAAAGDSHDFFAGKTRGHN